MLHVVLYQPEIPPNTGNIIRLCSNAGASLHLIHPLGFSMDEKQLRRAGLDYRDLCNLHEYNSYTDFIDQCSPTDIVAFTTKGKKTYSDHDFSNNEYLLFGPETRGLPDDVLVTFPDSHLLRLPMQSQSRSLNLSNTVAIGLYEAWRQADFGGNR